MNTEKIMLDAIFGACCNNPRSLSYIKYFVADGLIKGGYVEDMELDKLHDHIDETILQLRRDGLLTTTYHQQGEFHVRATDKFIELLNYTGVLH